MKVQEYSQILINLYSFEMTMFDLIGETKTQTVYNFCSIHGRQKCQQTVARKIFEKTSEGEKFITQFTIS